jgi:hypothetical protein
MSHPEHSTELRVLSAFPFPVQSSADLVEYARLLAERFERARGFLQQVQPEIAQMLLGWPP